MIRHEKGKIGHRKNQVISYLHGEQINNLFQMIMRTGLDVNDDNVSSGDEIPDDREGVIDNSDSKI